MKLNAYIRATGKHAAVVGGSILAAVVLAACGGSAAAPVVAAASATGSASASASGGASAYRACLQQHGVTLPSRAPGQGRPSGQPGGGPGGGGGFGGGNFSQSPALAAAMQACASLRPSGGAFGPRGGTALVAFRNCMTQQGVAIPTTRPSAPPTAAPSGSRYLGGLDPTDPKVAAALKVCSALLPTRPPAPQPSSSPTG